jgi:hypothetical protein
VEVFNESRVQRRARGGCLPGYRGGSAEVGEVVKIKSIEVDAEIGARALVARLDAPDAFIAPKYLRPFVSTT